LWIFSWCRVFAENRRKKRTDYEDDDDGKDIMLDSSEVWYSDGSSFSLGFKLINIQLFEIK